MFTHYNVGSVAIGLFAIYGISFALYKTRVIRIGTHRKVWNVLLLCTFLVAAVLGLLLAVRRDYVLLFSLPINMLFWHVEAAVAMTLISIFHLSWHVSYYLNLFRNGRERAEATDENEGVRDH